MQNFGFVVLAPPEVRAGTLVLALAIDRTHGQLTQSKETTTQIHAHLMYACARPDVAIINAQRFVLTLLALYFLATSVGCG